MLESRASFRTWICAALAVGLTAAAAPVIAQTVGELTVTGRYGVGPDVRSLSAPVSYRDLDLTTQGGRDVLRERVRMTAQDLCRRLGEAGAGGTALLPSCERDAVNSSAEQQRMAFAGAKSQAYAVNPPAEPSAAPVGPTAAIEPAPAAETYGQTASVTTQTVTSGPVPDTPENRARFGGPMSRRGQHTAPAGN
ncbi:UrcA family protein [Phenylobacterium sp. LjRoot225]|uniref:UrcA family protein n=1 Tax=Phenylobacterium sp. LjRoot225 TaxID=3342285 RepID=UPI003ECFC586